MTRDGLADVKDRGDVGLQQPLERLCRKILQRGAVLHSGVVDKDVNRAGFGLEAVNGLTHARVIGGIKGQDLDRGTLGPQGFRRCVQLCDVAPVQHNLRAGCGQALGKRIADTLRRPGDKRPLSRQIKQRDCHRHSPFFRLDKYFAFVYVIVNI